METFGTIDPFYGFDEVTPLPDQDSLLLQPYDLQWMDIEPFRKRLDLLNWTCNI